MNLIDRLADVVTRQRLLTGLIMLVATALAIWGYRYTPPPQSADSNDSSDERPRIQVATDELGGQPADCLLVVEVNDLFQPNTVAAVRNVVAAVEQLDYVAKVTWIDSIEVLNVFGLREPLLPREGASAERYAAARERILQHPLIRGQLLSADGRTLLMPVVFDWLHVTSDADCSTRLLATARDAAAHSPDRSLRIQLTGRVPLYIAYQQSFDRNRTRFQLIGYGLVFLLALILFRGLRAVLVVAAAPALGLVWTLGLLNWLGELSNPLTNVVLPVLLTMVGLTDGVHLMVHIRRARANGLTPQAAAHSAIRHVGLACALTSITTAIGFGSLLLAHSEFVRGFGRGCAIGVMVTFVAVVTSIPLAASTWIGRNIHKGHEHDLVGRGLNHFGGLINFAIRRANLVTCLAIVGTLSLAGIAAQLRPDDRMKDSQPSGSAAYQALAHCDQALGGIEFVRVLIKWPASRNETDAPQILAAIQAVERIVDKEPLLKHPLSILNILASFPGDESVTARLPFIELLPSGVRDSYYDVDKRLAVVTVRIQDLGIAKYEPVFRRVEQQLAALKKDYAGFDFNLTGGPVRRGRDLYRIVVDLASSVGAASGIIFVVMTIVYRSLRIGLITVIPNMFPLVVTATMMVLLGHPLEIASVCSFTVCLGIAVDDTIHFLTRFQTEQERLRDVDAALRSAFHGVGAAMIITTVILITGFGTVLTSELPGQRYFAAMAVSTIAAALVGDLVFLPALLKSFSPSARSA